MLIALQMMNFWLRNAYGDADTSFSRTQERPYMGLGQGSSGSNSRFTLTAQAPMVCAYKRKNFHAEIKSAWSDLLMTLAAIMYVDDMDMLLKVTNNTIEEFFAFIQAAIDFWGLLVMVSGGSLKEMKFQVKITSFTFSEGRPRIQRLKSLPDHQFEIPQNDGTTAMIPRMSIEEDVTALGFVNDLNNSG